MIFLCHLELPTLEDHVEKEEEEQLFLLPLRGLSLPQSQFECAHAFLDDFQVLRSPELLEQQVDGLT